MRGKARGGVECHGDGRSADGDMRRRNPDEIDEERNGEYRAATPDQSEHDADKSPRGEQKSDRRDAESHDRQAPAAC